MALCGQSTDWFSKRQQKTLVLMSGKLYNCFPAFVAKSWMKSFYEILELDEWAKADEIRSAYLRLAREYHPDRVPEHLSKLRADAEAKFKEVQQAWAVLGDPGKRRKYDLQLRTTSPKNDSHPPPKTSRPSTQASHATYAPSAFESLRGFLELHREIAKWVAIT